MGFFNILTVNIQCGKCGQFYEGRIQFKYGATRQLEYRMGDKLAWGYNENGEPGIQRVKVWGVSEREDCPLCGDKNQTEDFDIYLENDNIMSVSKMENNKDYLLNDEDFKILD